MHRHIPVAHAVDETPDNAMAAPEKAVTEGEADADADAAAEGIASLLSRSALCCTCISDIEMLLYSYPEPHDRPSRSRG